MKRANLVIGTRGSKLAMIYAENVKKELKKYYSKEIELKKMLNSNALYLNCNNFKFSNLQ